MSRNPEMLSKDGNQQQAGASKATLRLNNLPVELLNNITSYCEASAALSLCATCHRTRSASWTYRVFKLLLSNQQTQWPGPLRISYQPNKSEDPAVFLPDPSPWSDPNTYLKTMEGIAQNDVQTYSRFAIAIECANRLRGALENGFTGGRIHSVLQWAPHLVMYHHPFVASPWLATHIADVMTGQPFDTSRAFLYAAAMIGISSTGRSMILEADPGAKNHFMESCRTGRTPAKLYRALGELSSHFLSQLPPQGSHAVSQMKLPVA